MNKVMPNLTLLTFFFVLISAHFVTVQADNVEQRIHKLFQKLTNLDDKTMSWKCFARHMSNELQQKKEYHALAEKFSEISGLTSAISIGRALKPYEQDIPEPALTLYNSFNYFKLAAIIKARVDLNEKIECGHDLHHKDEL